MIYILEDDESIRKLVVYGLESQGFTVEGFALPSAFHRAMERALPELVLLDLMLPEEDGLHILRDLRASAATRTLPVILLTARDTEYDRVIGLDGGACARMEMLMLLEDYRAKEVQLEKVTAVLEAETLKIPYTAASHQGGRTHYSGWISAGGG